MDYHEAHQALRDVYTWLDDFLYGENPPPKDLRWPFVEAWQGIGKALTLMDEDTFRAEVRSTVAKGVVYGSGRSSNTGPGSGDSRRNENSDGSEGVA